MRVILYDRVKSVSVNPAEAIGSRINTPLVEDNPGDIRLIDEMLREGKEPFSALIETTHTAISPP